MLPILSNEIFMVTNHPEVIADSFFPYWKIWFVVVKLLPDRSECPEVCSMCSEKMDSYLYNVTVIVTYKAHHLKMDIDWFCFLFVFSCLKVLLLSILRSK